MVKFGDVVAGLKDEEAVSASRKEHGENGLPPAEVETFWEKLWETFSDDPMIRILVVALGVMVGLAFAGYADWVEGAGIAVAVILATFVATYSEFKNEESFRDLQEAASRTSAHVFRGARGSAPRQIPSADVVVGDCVLLEAGDKVPADGVLIAGEIQVNQASLNGENDALRKSVPDAVRDAHAAAQQGQQQGQQQGSPRSRRRRAAALAVADDAADVCAAATRQAAEDHEADDASDFLDAHLVFRGSVVDEGEGVLLVRSVGLNTEFGKLYEEMADSEDERESPLKHKLTVLADLISLAGYIGATFIAISFLFKQFVMDQGYDMARIAEYLSAANWGVAVNDVVKAVILAVIIVVVAVPEGLPMMIAIVLSLNMRKLLSSNVLVRRLLGIETAGSLTLLFVDKTGTLTKGQFAPRAFIAAHDAKPRKSFSAIPATLRDILGFAIRESTSAVLSDDDEGTPVGGNASDRALLSFLSEDVARARATGLHVEQELLFNSSRKFSATQLNVSQGATAVPDALDGEDGIVTLVKGAPEIVIGRCTQCFDDAGAVRAFSDADARRLDAAINASARSGVRTIAVAASITPIGGAADDDDASSPRSSRRRRGGAGAAAAATGGGSETAAALPEALTLVGVVGIVDEVRPETPAAIEEATGAGIQVIMITGDRKETAEAVAREVGLLAGGGDDDEDAAAADADSGVVSPPRSRSGLRRTASPARKRRSSSSKKTDSGAAADDASQPPARDLVLTSQDLQGMSDAQVREALPRLAVISRALPTDKSRLVKLSKKTGQVVGMTGDGVNDSAALKKADVGFAMGSGSEVAKEAADIVILDDNIASITKAVLYGRTIFRSIRKFIVFQSTVNVASFILTFAGPFLGFDFALTLIQLLWVNLVMDTLAALAFGGEPALRRYMSDAPIVREAGIISPLMYSAILFEGGCIGLMCVWALTYEPLREWFVRDGQPSTDAFLAAFFAFFIWLTAFNGFNVRTHKLNLVDNMLGNTGFIIVFFVIIGVQVAMTQFGGTMLRTVPLTAEEFGWVFAASASIVPLDFVRKVVLMLAGAGSDNPAARKPKRA